MNPKVIAFVMLLCTVSIGTLWATREYDEQHPIAADAVRIGS